MPDKYISADHLAIQVIEKKQGNSIFPQRLIFAVRGERFLFTVSPDESQRLHTWTPLGWQEITQWAGDQPLSEARLYQFVNKWLAGGEVTR